jgi:2-polyprenyl-3-methyl-5-hydroxy-6-metoxy-1,4-benzoquinol methylase
MDSCYLCGNSSFKKRPGRVRDGAQLDILECRSCGLVFLSSFAHITEGFYEDSRMHGAAIDIEKLVKDSAADDDRRFHTFKPLITNRAVLDFGCGNGGFLARAGKVASLAVGLEPERRLKPYFQKEQLTVYANLDEVNQCFDVITLFHVLEHLPDPINVLKQLANKLNANGWIIIEVPNANDALLTLYESNAFAGFTYWSCHLYLFNENTLSLLAGKAGLKTSYIKQVQRYPLSNHLWWLARNQPGGHIHWSFLDSRELHDAYEKQLGAIGCCDTLIAGFRADND